MRVHPLADDGVFLQQSARELARMLPALMVDVRRTASTMAPGIHGRRKAGAGETFWQYRPYSTSDAARRIDWRKSARSDRLFVRETEWEAAHTVWFWPDMSASMAVHSDAARTTKQYRALLLALALADLLAGAGEKVGAWGADRAYMAHRAVENLAGDWLQGGDSPAGQQSMPPPALAPLPGADAVFLSDFMIAPERLDKAFRAMAARGIRGHLLQILDPAEENPPFSGRVEFHDPEGPRSLVIGRAQALRDRYRRRLADHRENLEVMARRCGWSFSVHHTDAPPTPALLALYQALSRDGRQP